jgi:hypothetical protein
MVKIPGFDDLKKMGSGLVDSAKSVKIGDMVDKLKTGIDSVSASIKKSSSAPQTSEEVKKLFADIHAALDELTETQTKTTATVRKIHGQLAELARVFEAQHAAQTPSADVKQEEKKNL